MEPSWQHQQGFYYADKPNVPPHHHHTTSPQSSQDEGPTHRRALTHPASASLFPPPPPPSHSASTQIGLPPFNAGFYSAHYSSSSGGHSTSTSAPANMMQYPGSASGGTAMAAPSSGYPYPMTSPMSHHVHPLPIGRGPSHPSHLTSESPRMPPGPPAPWSTSPGFHHLSPTSPTTHLVPPGMPASSSTSSSSFPSVTRTPGHLPGTGSKKNIKRSGSVTHSNESWDDEKYGPLDEMGEETEDQPWGMPQEEYKALNPRDKKQVRNRIGARRFRAKRKNYVSNLEGSIRSRDEEIARLRSQVEQHRAEINDLRGRLGIPPLSVPPPPPAPLPSGMESGLGLVVNHADGWDESKSEL